jgi:hypothetical protein
MPSTAVKQKKQNNHRQSFTHAQQRWKCIESRQRTWHMRLKCRFRTKTHHFFKLFLAGDAF